MQESSNNFIFECAYIAHVAYCIEFMHNLKLLELIKTFSDYWSEANILNFLNKSHESS